MDDKYQEIQPEEINGANRGTLMDTLGIRFTHLSPGRSEAIMTVTRNVCQPFGLLHGGASLALAESVAGQGSLILCSSDEAAAGVQVSGNHVSPAREGDRVKAVGTLIHQGRSTHIWNVDIFTSAGGLVSTVRVVNTIIKRR
jgi:1,4-dihydroxy-2-naphthoyl-CoA hydrolase